MQRRPDRPAAASRSRGGGAPRLVAAEAAPAVLPRRLPVLLRRAWFGLNQAFRRRILHLGLTPDQYTVLRTLSEESARGLTQRELTKRMASDPNTIAALVERMERAALVERHPHERDGRAYRLRLCPQGESRFQSARRVALALQAEVMESLPGAEHARFLEQLESVGAACQRMAESASRRPSP